MDPAARQIELARERVAYMVRQRLRENAAIIKATITRERLSGPPGVRRRTGNLQRSLRLTVTTPGTTKEELGGSFRLSAKIGGERARYAVELERRGRLGFLAMFEREARRVLTELQSEVSLLGRVF